MVDFLKIIDFSEEIKKEPRLEAHLNRAAKELSERTKTLDEYKQPFFDQELNNIVVLVGLPVTKGEITEKLYKVLQKILTDRGLPVPEKVNFGQLGEKTNGTAVFEFADAEAAKNVAKALDNFPLDKIHQINACTIMEFDQIMATEDVYEPPKILTHKELQEWLVDSRFREQILIRRQNKIRIDWFDHVRKETEQATSDEIVINGKEDCQWSKSGSYLVSFNEKGFTLYGGLQFEQIAFFEHPNVKAVEFSPDEKYVLSFNGTVLVAPNSENYIVWNIITKEKIRVFKAEQDEDWGSFKWSFDGTYIAKKSKDKLSIYKLPAMSLLEDPSTNKPASFIIPNIQTCVWSPKKNFICAVSYTHERTNPKNEMNGKVHIIQIPERTEMKWKIIPWFINSCEIHWDSTGTKAILIFSRLKGKKQISTMIQVGDLSRRDISVEEKEFENVRRVNIDENCTKIALIYNPPQGATSGTIKFDVGLLKIDLEKGVLREIGTLIDKTLSHVLWSPNGAFFALVNTEKTSANLGFLEFGFIRPNNQIEVIKSSKIAYMNYAAWDQSGRCLLTCSETGNYIIWNGLGEQLLKDTAVGLSQIDWRPRPKIALNEEKEQEILQNLIKKYAKKYEEEDDKIINSVKYERERIRAEKRKEFLTFLSERRKEWEGARKQRIELVGFDEDNMDYVDYEEIIEDEIVLETK